MIDWNRIGPQLAVTLAGTAVAGAVLLILLDFAMAGDAAAPLADRLKDVTAISLFVKVDVPGSDLKVHTGTEYADAAALAAGHASQRWCYVLAGKTSTAFAPNIMLGHQTGDAPPVFGGTNVTAAEARMLGLAPDQLDAIAHRDCRFGPDGSARS